MLGYENHATRSGVTLIEAILVITVLSAAAVASAFVLDDQWATSRNVRDITSETASTLQAARNTAINNQSAVRVRRSRRNRIEQLEVIEEAGPFQPERRRMIQLDDQIRFSGRPNQVRFTADGAADRAATWNIRQGSVGAQINVTPVSGQVVTRLP